MRSAFDLQRFSNVSCMTSSMYSGGSLVPKRAAVAARAPRTAWRWTGESAMVRRFALGEIQVLLRVFMDSSFRWVYSGCRELPEVRLEEGVPPKKTHEPAGGGRCMSFFAARTPSPGEERRKRGGIHRLNLESDGCLCPLTLLAYKACINQGRSDCSTIIPLFTERSHVDSADKLYTNRDNMSKPNISNHALLLEHLPKGSFAHRILTELKDVPSTNWTTKTSRILQDEIEAEVKLNEDGKDQES